MNPRIETLSLALASTLPISLAGIGHAASVTYDADLGTTSAQDGAGAGWNADPGNTSFWNGTANVVWPNTTADEIIFGAGSGAAGEVTVGAVSAGKITFGTPGSGNYSLTGGTVTLGGTPTIAVNSDTSIASTLTGTVGLNITGTGALTLTGSQTYNGALSFTNKSVTFSGSSASTATNNAILIGGASGRTVVNFNSSGSFTYGTTTGNTRIGGNDGSGDTGAGAVNQTSGTVTFARNSTYLELGTNTGANATSYGSYLLTGGTLNTTVNGGARIGNGGFGVFTQTGGTANIGRWLAIGATTGATSASKGVVTLTGGNLTVNSGYRTLLGDRATASAVLNIGTQAGGTATMTNANAGGPNGSGIILLNATNAASATVNLNSGTMVLGGGIARNGTTAGSLATVNLNGGTLRPSVNNLNLINSANGLSANVYNGGLKVDTQAFDASISANLLATTGNGIYPAGGILNLLAADGVGYIGAPVVTVTTSGTGTGATAVANIANGQVTGVALTSPGQGFLVGDTVTFTFAGGGATTPAVPFIYTLTAGDIAANGAGGLTKLGTGKLTLSGTNTFTGPINLTGTLESITALTLANTTVSINGFTPGSLNAPILANNGLTTGGTVVLQVPISGTIATGKTPLIYYTPGGSIGGSGFAALQLQTGTLPRGVSASLVNNTDNSSVDLSLAATPLTWKATTNNAWDINTTTNWTIGGVAGKYLEGDVVLFNDTVNGTNPSVALNTAVAPQSVTFDNNSKDYTLSGTGSIGGTASIAKTGVGKVTLLTSIATTGTTTVDVGTLQIGNGTDNGNISGPLVNNDSVIFHPAGTATHGGAISGGSGTFRKEGTGTQIITSPTNTFGGNFEVNGGTLQFGNVTANGAAGTATYKVAAGASLRFDQATATALPSGGFTGAGNIFLNSAQAINGSADWGALALGSEYTGVLRVEKGRVNATGGAAALGSVAKIEILPGAQFLAFASEDPYIAPIEIAGTGWGENGYPCALRLAADRTATWAGAITLTADSGIMAQRNTSFTIKGAITGAYQCEFYSGDPVAENGNLIVQPATPGQNTYASTKINGRPGGSVLAGSDDAFSPGPLVVDNAILKLNGHNLSFASLAGAGGAIGNYSTTTPVTITVGSAGTDTSYAGMLRNGDAASLALTKTGTGTLTLTAAQSYTGNTTVAQGKLVIANSTFADASTVTINSGAVLELTAATADVVGSLVLGGTAVAPGIYSATHPTYGAFFAGGGSLVVGGAYDSWAASKGLTGDDALPEADPDKDGMSNLTEFYLDGNPLASDQSILPAGGIDATYLTFTFHRRDDAEASVTTQAIQYGSTLGSWTDVAIGATSSTSPNGVIVTVAENDAAADLITVQIPRTLATEGKIFGRLQVVK